MSEKNYNFTSRLLHQLALSSNAVAHMSFELEQLVHNRGLITETENNHVFVAGLARAGTTILMRRIFELGEFTSLTYRDMPFVLAPNLWHSINRHSSITKDAEERAHKDGLLVDFDSPEALEEVFWRVFCCDKYIRNDCLTPMSASTEEIENFRRYIATILKKGGKKRYLSKNNNNILRLSSISEAFPNAVILIPFREPHQHAFSIYKTHKTFRQEGLADEFFRKYMGWLVHYEFGIDHRPFVFHPNTEQDFTPEDLDYWLKLWISSYSHITDALPRNAHLVSYERLCRETGPVWEKLCEIMAVDPGKMDFDFTESSTTPEIAGSAELLAEARHLYDKMNDLSI